MGHRGLGRTHRDARVVASHDVEVARLGGVSRPEELERRARVSGLSRHIAVSGAGAEQLTYWKADWGDGEAGDGSTARKKAMG